MIDHTKAKTNRELLEAATSFKFPGYKYFDERSGKEKQVPLYIYEMETHGKKLWIIDCHLGTYDIAENKFNYYRKYGFKETAFFNTPYEAYEVVKELIKRFPVHPV